MELAGRISATTDQVVGASKDRMGAVIGKVDLQTQGQAQNAVGRARRHDEDVEDTARDIIKDRTWSVLLRHGLRVAGPGNGKAGSSGCPWALDTLPSRRGRELLSGWWHGSGEYVFDGGRAGLARWIRHRCGIVGIDRGQR